ncbi:MAG: hypothetical protein IPK82_37290 [Polyangiaceae bacterium]|nr:hypothetical protein [Polyangiaceae bacterium]
MPSRAFANTSISSVRLALLAVAALVPMMTGCEIPVAMMIADDINNEDEYVNDYYGDGYYGSEGSALQTKNARIDGSLGDAIAFSGDAEQVDAWHDGYSTNLTFWASGNGAQQWAAMAAISISDGGISNTSFVPGATLHFDGYSSSVYSWGCSGTGSDADMLDYEASGSTTDIDVSESSEPGMVHLSITTTFEGYDTPVAQIVHTELDIVVPE